MSSYIGFRKRILLERIAAKTVSTPSAPRVESISPNRGTIAGGTSVTVMGRNLTDATGASVGGVPLTSVSVVDDLHLTGVTGAHAASGAVDVAVTNGVGTTTLAGAFTYVAPEILYLSKNAIASAGGTTTIWGSGFTDVTAVDFDAATPTFSIVDDGRIDVSTGFLFTGLYLVKAILPPGESNTAPLLVYSVDNATIPRGANVTISGETFSTTSAVTVNGEAATYSITNDNTLVVTVPNDAATGSADIAITTTTATFTLSGAISVTDALPAPTFSSMTYSVVDTGGGGATQTITGANFVNGSVFVVDGSDVATTYVSATQLTCSMPAHAANASVPCHVRNLDGQTTATINVEYWDPTQLTSVTCQGYFDDRKSVVDDGTGHVATWTNLGTTVDSNATLTDFSATGKTAPATAVPLVFNGSTDGLSTHLSMGGGNTENFVMFVGATTSTKNTVTSGYGVPLPAVAYSYIQAVGMSADKLAIYPTAYNTVQTYGSGYNDGSYRLLGVHVWKDTTHNDLVVNAYHGDALLGEGSGNGGVLYPNFSEIGHGYCGGGNDVATGDFWNGALRSALVLSGKPNASEFLKLSKWAEQSFSAIRPSIRIQSSNYLVGDTGGGGQAIVLTGGDFTGATAVYVDGSPVVPDAVTSTTVTFTLPAHAAGDVSIYVATPSGNSNSIRFTYWDPTHASYIDTYLDVRKHWNDTTKIWHDPVANNDWQANTGAGASPPTLTANVFGNISSLRFAKASINSLTATTARTFHASNNGRHAGFYVSKTSTNDTAADYANYDAPMTVLGWAGGWNGMGYDGSELALASYNYTGATHAEYKTTGASVIDGNPHLLGYTMDYDGTNHTVSLYKDAANIGTSTAADDLSPYGVSVIGGGVSNVWDMFDGDLAAVVLFGYPPPGDTLRLLRQWSAQSFGTPWST